MNGENDTMYYVQKDYLGSYDVITDETGNVLERLSFDPWGRRRNPETWTFTNLPANHLFDRGYTGHEHLDVFSLINMNGRVYDPWLGRFLSPDPVVQSPGYNQSYNRYSYCFNNPLKYIDHSGYNAWKFEENPMHFGGDSPNYNPYSYQGYMGPGSGYHWSDPLRGKDGNFNIMSESTFVSIYGQDEYDKQVFNNAVETYTGKDAQSVFQRIIDGFNVYSIFAFHHKTLVCCLGELGPLRVADNGGLRSDNPTASAYIPEAQIFDDNVTSAGWDLIGLSENNFVEYSIEGVSVWAGTIQTGFDAARKLQPTVTTWIRGAKVIGKTSNILGVASIGYDFATGTANSSTIADGLVLAGGAAAIFFGGVAFAPWVAGAGVLYGIVSIAGGEAWLDRNIDISGYINIVKSSKP